METMTLEQVNACIDTFKVADLNVARQAVLSLAESYAAHLARQSEGVSDEDVKRIADETVKSWQAQKRMIQYSFDFRGLIADGIRAALTAVRNNRPAQEKAEPVAYRWWDGTGWMYGNRPLPGDECHALYTAPPAERVRVPDGWQPIETAPKSTADGTRVNGIYLLGFVPDSEDDFDRQAMIDIIWWEPLLRNPRGGRGVWRTSAGGESVDVEPTHWMPLPMAPEADHG